MAKKRTKFDKSQRQASRLEKREEMRPEPPSPEAAWTQPAASEPSAELEERIRQRAYEIYIAGGREDGHDVDHWLQAEAEIVGNRPKRATER